MACFITGAPMAINIRNAEVERLIDELKSMTGKGTTEIVLELVRDENARQRKLLDIEERRRRIQEISRRFCARLGPNPPTPDEIIGYDENGLPT
ncbi:MAG: type II toxin-antitoxin system VapB family antitoxin [Deltaproteobacteria bacterium]|nr:type II toxin-antitoxin system VapB family antitoxin [Deltaproteobacteria bacterium]